MVFLSNHFHLAVMARVDKAPAAAVKRLDFFCDCDRLQGKQDMQNDIG
jgi:hypothetical protein